MRSVFVFLLGPCLLLAQSTGTILGTVEDSTGAVVPGASVHPEKGSTLEEVTVESSNNANMSHWANFLECVKTRQKPISDIEIGHRSTTTALLGNVALRSKLRIDWDPKAETCAQTAGRKFLHREYRKPWKLEV